MCPIVAQMGGRRNKRVLSLALQIKRAPTASIARDVGYEYQIPVKIVAVGQVRSRLSR